VSARADVLIAGAGPVGLYLAAELARRGCACTIIERATVPSTHSKALAVMPGTMELFERSGIARAFEGAANRIDGVRFVTPRSSALVPFSAIASRYNYVSILPQWKTEEILRAHLRTYGADVCYSRELVDVELTGGGAIASIRMADGVQRLHARYVVGCDGVYSTVRERTAIPFTGGSYPGRALLADALLETSVPENEARVHAYAAGVVTMFPIDARLRRIVVIAPGEQLPDRADPRWLQERAQRAGYTGVRVEKVVWSNAFVVHRRIAAAMRRGNVLLAGDSVHTHSPVGGQGMNIGLHDACNLAAKLGAVLRGEEPEALLDAYERERLPVARAVLRRTDMLTRALLHPHPALRMAREMLAPALVRMPVVYTPVIRALALTA
jgi:2-polyprenyl-6-methoxyphenol hydroxylase-like FAD-dependent oxidoreductase